MNLQSINAAAMGDAKTADLKNRRKHRGDKVDNKASIAEELFLEGYNCSQSVVAAFSDELGLDRETALKLASSFGGGMGRLREVCGAVSGMFLIAGLKDGYSNPKDSSAKAEHYQLIQKLAQEFKEENGSIICRELLGLPNGSDSPIPEARTPGYYQKRPCVELVKSAAKILQEYWEENQI